MSTQYNVQDYLRTALTTNVALTTWLNTQFDKALTVLLGNRKNKVIAAKGFPSVSIVFDPKEVDGKYTSENAHLVEEYHVDMGLHFAKTTELDDTHLQLIAEFERLVGLAITADRRMGGLVIGCNVVGRIGDANVNHPFHFFTLILKVERTAPY